MAGKALLCTLCAICWLKDRMYSQNRTVFSSSVDAFLAKVKALVGRSSEQRTFHRMAGMALNAQRRKQTRIAAPACCVADEEQQL